VEAKDAADSFTGTSRFRVVRRLGAGGMGVVYEALDLQRSSRVALKTLRALDAAGLLRFKDEFRALQDLQHPNLISLGELIEEHGQWFFTMELVAGVDFLEHVRKGVISSRESSPSAISGAAAADTMTQTDFHSDVHSDVQMISAETPPSGVELPRRGHAFDEQRLRDALRQLAAGLVGLHDAGKVHRDIKPSNILVTPEGRVVLLDFGLVTESRVRAHSTDANVVGTAAYMAPEQAASKPVGPAADWYSLGVVLYEALTGALPFDGTPLAILMSKQLNEAPAPRALDPRVPEDLNRLCVELLRFDPASRPSGDEIARRLGMDEPSTRMVSMIPGSQSATFIGRAREFAALRSAYATACSGRAVTVYVYGESGVGKSSLVKKFCDELTIESDRNVVLRGRCYERESVPYKAVDGVIDALSRFLPRVRKRDAEAIVPLRASLLTQVFPVLRRVEAFAHAPRASYEAIDPQELRGRLFTSVRELFERLADRYQIVIVIDDLQWADADSLALLREVMRPPGAPPILLIATVRPTETTRPIPQAEDDEDEGPKSRLSVGSSLMMGDVREVHVGRLSNEEAHELATQLLERAAPKGWSDHAGPIANLVAESGGHPLFIDELVRHALLVGDKEGDHTVRLEDALCSRIALLDPDVRDLLEIVTIAGTPLLKEVAAKAARTVDFTAFEKRLSLLRVANLLRTTNVRGEVAVEPFHDRVRAAVASTLDAGRTTELHERIALALEGSEPPDAEALADHWRGAGNGERASKYAQMAAVAAEEALAFERAARLFRLAIELAPPGTPSLHAMRVSLGDALASAGRGLEAAEAYLAAGRDAVPSDEATISAALDLQRRAAVQLLISGHIDRGLEAVKTVLAALDIPYPPTPQRAFASLLLRRAQVRIRGVRFKEKKPSEISATELTRIDVCTSLAVALGIVDTVRGADFQSRGLLLALAAGEPYRVSRALAFEGAFIAAGGIKKRARAEEMLATAEAIARRVSNPLAMATSVGVRGVVAFLAGDWKSSYEHCVRAEKLVIDRRTPGTWELYAARFFALRSCVYLGNLREVCERVPGLVREAEERGNLFAATGLRSGYTNLAWLARGLVDDARFEVEEAIRTWNHHGFHVQHCHHALAQSHIELYAGDPARGYEIVREMWPRFEESLIAMTQQQRIDMTYLHARLSIATERWREAEKDAHTLSKESAPWGVALGLIVTASIAAGGSDVDEVVRLLDRAIVALDATGMDLHAVVARWHRGRIRKDEAGVAARGLAEGWMRENLIAEPPRFAATILPGFSRRALAGSG
jgi:serine/threonine protein kinase